MNISDLISIGTIVAALNIVLGYWVKSRLESSIKHEYDRKLENIKGEWKRFDILYSERLSAFKQLQKRLVSLKRYCQSHVGSELGSEFSPRPEDLDADDCKSILSHWNELEPLLDENLIFMSSSCNATFKSLRSQLSLGAHMELCLVSIDPEPEIVDSKADSYAVIILQANECINALFKDLGFPNET